MYNNYDGKMLKRKELKKLTDSRPEPDKSSEITLTQTQYEEMVGILQKQKKWLPGMMIGPIILFFMIWMIWGLNVVLHEKHSPYSVIVFAIVTIICIGIVVPKIVFDLRKTHKRCERLLESLERGRYRAYALDITRKAFYFGGEESDCFYIECGDFRILTEETRLYNKAKSRLIAVFAQDNENQTEIFLSGE
ncbi:MAG: hypothetical protein FWG83_03000 [Oscillospiraceae bacterium]|nr:hypothetical protein [Oscillospiraceae bacterium]